MFVRQEEEQQLCKCSAITDSADKLPSLCRILSVTPLTTPFDEEQRGGSISRRSFRGIIRSLNWFNNSRRSEDDCSTVTFPKWWRFYNKNWNRIFNWPPTRNFCPVFMCVYTFQRFFCSKKVSQLIFHGGRCGRWLDSVEVSAAAEQCRTVIISINNHFSSPDPPVNW